MLVGITDGTVAVTARVELAEVNRTTMSDLLDTLSLELQRPLASRKRTAHRGRRRRSRLILAAMHHKRIRAARPPGEYHYWRSCFLDDLTDDVIDVLVEQSAAVAAPPLVEIVVEHMGGAIRSGGLQNCGQR